MTVTVSAVILGVSLALTVSQTSAERGAQAPPAGPADAPGRYLALQYATGAGTSYGLVAPSPGLVVRMVPVRR